MSDLPNPHDRFFKELLAPPEAAVQFLRFYLPAPVVDALDLTTLEVVKDSFVDAQLRAYFSDLLFRVRLQRGGAAFVYLLLEHKSAPEESVALQLLTYLVKLWEPQLRSGARPLPLVIPVVFYHGRERWQVSPRFGALFDFAELEALREYAPEFSYHLCDLSQQRELPDEGRLKAGLTALKYVFSDELPARLAEIFETIKQLPEPRGLEYIKTVLRYLSRGARNLTVEDVQTSLRATFPENEGGLMQTLAENWIEQGIQQGIQQGAQRQAAALALRQLQRRFGVLDAETQERIRALPVERLEKLSDALLDFQARSEVTEWLQAHTEVP
jgi:predicted transposase/invertase (TIGR01784 family)